MIRTQTKIIGIVGGLGPYSHLQLEHRILEETRSLLPVREEQQFPEWILSAIPQTPDRTLAIGGKTEDPAPWLLRSLRRLESFQDSDGKEVRGADFAIICCNTAHYFVPRLRSGCRIPIVSMIEETAAHVARICPGARVGILGTTGTLKSRIYHDELATHGLTPISLLDLQNGEERQRKYVMEAIYGPWNGERHTGNGIKSNGGSPEFAASLGHAAKLLIDEGRAGILITGCTEIDLVLTGPSIYGVPLADPVRIIANVAVKIAFGMRLLEPVAVSTSESRHR